MSDFAKDINVPINDCISRQAAIEALYDWEMTYDWDEHCREEPKSPCIVSPSDVIDELPSAQPERETGEWIEIQYRVLGGHKFIKSQRCSKCGKIKDKYVTWNFCPNCGKDMRKRKNNVCK